MANGDVIATKDGYRHVKMVDAKGATDDGQWLDTFGYEKLNVEITGITTATVKLNGSNAATIPDNTAHGQELSSATADGMITLDNLPRWIKARISAWTTGTISVLGRFSLPRGARR